MVNIKPLVRTTSEGEKSAGRPRLRMKARLAAAPARPAQIGALAAGASA